jgi:hypothetical protein
LFPGVVSGFQKHSKTATKENKFGSWQKPAQKHSIENQSTMRIAGEQFRKFMTKTATFVINVYGNKSCMARLLTSPAIAQSSRTPPSKGDTERTAKTGSKTEQIGRECRAGSGFCGVTSVELCNTPAYDFCQEKLWADSHLLNRYQAGQ